MLTRRRPAGDVFTVVRSFDDLFRDALDQIGAVPAETAQHETAPAAGFAPSVDCFVRDRNLIIRAELPGVDPSQVTVNVVDDRLVISGEKKEQREVTQDKIYIQELTHGTFERSFRLPKGVMAEHVKASFTNGVLEVTLPAEPLDAVRRVVPIETAEGGQKSIKAA